MSALNFRLGLPESSLSLGLSPELLHQLLQEAHNSSIASFKGKEREQTHFLLDGTQLTTDVDSTKLPRITYELATDSKEIQPRLRMWTYVEHDVAISSSTNPSSISNLSLDDEHGGDSSGTPEYAHLFMYTTTSKHNYCY